ncbi:hypothetical protein, partial [Rothia nasimurium]|uniref:hypothetical protein n=1 Tax=Rothia nasimurium TaxID=85336 RepID=UPI001F318A24
MAVEDDAVAAGFTLPHGKSEITNGDDAITENAIAAYTLFEKSKWHHGRITPASTPSVDNAPQGYAEVWTLSDAQAYGLPGGGTGVIETFTIGNTAYQRFTTWTFAGGHQLFQRLKTSQGWQAWQKISNTEKPWANGRITPASTPSVDNAPQGYAEVWTLSDAQAYGLPGGGTGVIETFT